MKTIARSVCALLAMATLAMAASPQGLIITDDGYYVTLIENGVPTNVKVTQIMDLRGGGGGGGGGGDVTPPPPTANPLVDAVAQVTKAKLNIEEATALAAGLNLSRKVNVPDSAMNAAMNSTVTVVGGSIGAKTKVDDWYKAIQAAPGFTFTQKGLADTIAGIVKAYNLDPEILKSLSDTAVAAHEDGKTVEQAAEMMQQVFPNAAFDWTKIFTILMQILELITGLFG